MIISSSPWLNISFQRSKMQDKNACMLLESNNQGKDTVSFTKKTPDSKSAKELLNWLRSSYIRNSMKANPVKTIKTIMKIEAIIKQLTEATSAVPKGFLERKGNKLKIISYDTDTGWNTKGGDVFEITIPENVNVFEPDTNMDVILNKCFPSNRPFVTVGTVGWSDLNAYGPNLQTDYEDAFNKFMTPILEYLEINKLNPERIANVASFSYCGIDKAVMDFVKNKEGLNLLTIGPYRFAKYINKNHDFPLILENTVTAYAKKFSEFVDFTIIAGGRTHPWIFDSKNQLIDNKRTIIPVDLLKMYCNIEIPARNANGAPENDAALLKELGVNPFGEQAKKIFEKMPDTGKELLEFDEQKAVAAMIYELYESRRTAASLF